MRRLIVFFLLVAAGSAPASAQLACTQIGCEDGLAIRVPHNYAWQPGLYGFDFVIDGKPLVCRGALPLPRCGMGAMTCSGGDVMITESGCALLHESHGFGDIWVRSGPKEISLKVTYNGKPVAQQKWTPMYKMHRPNGPYCGPVCRQANVTLEMR